MWEVYTNIQLDRYWYPPWNTGALRRSRPILLVPDFSKLFSRADSNEGRLTDGLQTKNCFFWDTRTHWRLPLLAFCGTWPSTTRETKLLMLRHVLHVPHLNNIRDADSCSGRTLTNSWWGNGFGTKPPLPCIFYRLPLGQNLFAARLQINDNGASFNIISSRRVKSSAVPAFAGSTSDPLTQPSSSSPSNNCPKRWKAEESSPPITISGRKQLSPWPHGERAATVERMVITRSSRKRRQSLRNSLRRKLLLTFSRDDNRRVPSRKCSSGIAPKHEWFGSMYASYFSITGKSLLRFTFCKRQYTKRESSPNAKYPQSARPEFSSVKLGATKTTQTSWNEHNENWTHPHQKQTTK